MPQHGLLVTAEQLLFFIHRSVAMAQLQQQQQQSEPRRKAAWGTPPRAACVANPTLAAEPACLETACGFCCVNLTNVPESLRKIAQPLISPTNRSRNAAYLLTRTYCSEVCTIRDAMELIGDGFRTAFILRMLEVNSTWDADTFDKIRVTRGCRSGQVHPAPSYSAAAGAKLARHVPQQTPAVAPADGMVD